MKNKLIIIIALLVAAYGQLIRAGELVLSDSDMANLGVEFAVPRSTPTVAGGAALLEARAYVLVPPDRDHVIASINSGLVLRLHAANGQRVTRGELLAELQSPDYLSLQQMFVEAQQEAELNRSRLERDQQLHDEGIIAGRRLQETRADALAATAAANEHRQLLRIAGMNTQDIETLASTGAISESMAMRAPVDGVILETWVTVGERVDAAQGLYRLGDVSELWLDIQVPQERADLVTPGMRVELVAPAANYLATVIAVGQSVDLSTQTVSIRAALEPGSRGLRPGQLVAVQIQTGTGNEALALPLSALIRSGAEAYVFLRVAGGLDAHAVSVISQTHDQVFVSGLDTNVDVAVRGVSALKAVWLESLDSASE